MIQHGHREFEGAAGDGTIVWPAPLLRAGASVVRRPAWQKSVDRIMDFAGRIDPSGWSVAAGALGVLAIALAWGGAAQRSTAFPTKQPVHSSPAVAATAALPTADVAAISGAPIRLTGTMSGNLTRSLLGAGATPAMAADYIAAIGTRFDVGTIANGDRFDLVASPGGRLLYAGILHRGEPFGLMRWTLGGREQWLDAAGTGAPSDGFIVPVADARLSSGFGMRFHPVLGFSRMHQGIDLAAPLGTPIMAAAEGVVRFSGAHGGYGNFVQVQHNGGMGSGYGHMSAIVVQPGQMVRQGQLLGYVGSTGLSTGPHCHFEIYREGTAIDPTTANYAVEAQLGGEDLAQFRLALARVTAVPAGR